MNVLLGPTNYANQPVALTRALRAAGEDAHHVLYAWSQRAGYGFDRDRVCELGHEDWLSKQWQTVRAALDEGVEVFHLWNRSLVYQRGAYGFFSGLDLPFLKASGAKIIYRFTGYDLRRRSLDMELNPYSPFHRGYESPYDEASQERYIDYLRAWVDDFVVQDPEMQAFLPEARILPRGVDLKAFDFVGVGNSPRPLVVHAPSSPELKGTAAVLDAVERLRRRSVPFEFKLIEDMDHEEAMQWYRRADVVIDQLLIGWYGVLAVEAMALGKPVIAYVREPLPSTFNPKLPVVNATVGSLAEVLHELLRNADRRARLGREGRQFVEQVHDIDHIALAAQRLYRETPAQRPSAAQAMRHLESAGGPAGATLRKAQLWDRTAPTLRELRQNAGRWERVAEEIPTLRRKAREWDAIEPSLSKAHRWKAMEADLQHVRRRWSTHLRPNDSGTDRMPSGRDRLSRKFRSLAQRLRRG